ncbi:GNAT family N-acetyltransferase [Paenibacillus azoreducens]|uniref:N-acetyltransferase domain-containing protein n=2 Tax=Paenibacillus azoreducens TaxID=116718 RepID=A0A919YBT2_9BACL|nr:GNAT family protein [Paenibacillus azoreducens]GIO46115.1 hypothetical protein J34TS1_08800 [Paenibacillus azoreducens]
MKICGENVVLTKILAEDLEFLIRIETDESLWSFEESVKSEEEAREEYLQKLEEDEGESYDFIIRLAGDPEGTPIGIAQIWSYVDFRRSWEIGFAVLPEYGGRGYGSEAAKLLLQFGFEQLDAHKIVGMCNSKNDRSAALMERIGMTREGVFKEELFWNDEWTDQYYFSILEREYRQSEAAHMD